MPETGDFTLEAKQRQWEATQEIESVMETNRRIRSSARTAQTGTLFYLPVVRGA